MSTDLRNPVRSIIWQ